MNMMARTHEVSVQTKAPGKTKERLVVIGNGMAGCRAVEELLKRDPDRYEITIFGAEPRVNYNRIMLSPVLAGREDLRRDRHQRRRLVRDNGITLHRRRAGRGDRPRRPDGHRRQRADRRATTGC